MFPCLKILVMIQLTAIWRTGPVLEFTHKMKLCIICKKAEPQKLRLKDLMCLGQTVNTNKTSLNNSVWAPLSYSENVYSKFFSCSESFPQLI